MATGIVSQQLNIFITTGEAQKALDVLIAKETKLKDELAKATDPRQVTRLTAELKRLEEPLDRARKKVSGELGPSFRDLQNTVTKLSAQLKQLSTNDADYSKVLKQYREANTALDVQRQKLLVIQQAQGQMSSQSPFANVVDFAKGAFLGAGMIGVVQGFQQFLGDSINEALDAEEATARLKSQLDNLGRSEAFDSIISKTNEIANKFKYLDNDDVTGVFEKLINYGKLTQKQMDDLLPVIVNFAAKQRIPIQDASDVIIKALEGNARALKEYGISVKEAGTPTERLGVIMTTLKEKVEGAGEAFQNTAAGSMAVDQATVK
jgi:hypothetical protein